MWIKMSDIFGRLKIGAEKVVAEADKVAHVKRLELDIGGLKKQVEGQYQKLGELSYRSLVNKEPESTDVSSICAKITELFDQMKLKEEEIKKVNAGQASTTQTQQEPKKKFCTNCGKEQDPSVKFCSECGAKMV
jgi:NADH pyrophosphatase NudC (nudix superfamily)